MGSIFSPYHDVALKIRFVFSVYWPDHDCSLSGRLVGSGV